MQFILHAGAPRTGTTVIQKHISRKCKNTLVLQKKAYGAASIQVTENNYIEIRKDLSNSLKSIDPRSEPDRFANNFFLVPLIPLAAPLPIEGFKEIVAEAASKALQSAEKHKLENILISTERCTDSFASLLGNSNHIKHDRHFSVYPLIKAINRGIDSTTLVTICLRNPINYIASKYKRTVAQRIATKNRFLSPLEYIQKQAYLETNYPGTSALTPAMHSEFIKQLQQHAFVKAFGFKELLASDDVFSLMGLQGEDKYAFRDFPRENKLPFTKNQEQAIEIEITKALKQYGFYDRIMKAQMFE